VLRASFGEPSPEELAAHLCRQRAEERALLERVAFPVYELADWDGPRRLDGYAGYAGSVSGLDGELEQPTEVTLVFGEPTSVAPWAQITTDSEGKLYYSDRELAAEALLGVLRSPDAVPPDGSDAAISLWFESQDRATRARAAHARTTVQEVPVDDRRVRFTIMETDGYLGAAAGLDDARITIAGQLDAARIRIRRARDLSSYVSDGDG
jgi:hypothetical protein